MTSITTSELKILAIQLILMAILTAFMALYSAFQDENTPEIPSYSPTTSISASGASWITDLLSIPEGMETMVLISLLVISPFLFFDIFIIAPRFLKDLGTQWV